MLVVYAVLFFDKVKLDDPVGALSVHLVNGVFGTLCVGLFATDGGLFMGGGFAKTLTQLTGIAAVGAVTFTLSMAAWYLLKATVGVRVSAAGRARRSRRRRARDGSLRGLRCRRIRR